MVNVMVDGPIALNMNAETKILWLLLTLKSRYWHGVMRTWKPRGLSHSRRYEIISQVQDLIIHMRCGASKIYDFKIACLDPIAEAYCTGRRSEETSFIYT